MALSRNRLIAAKVETTEGIDATPDAATEAVQVLDLEIGVDTDEVEREIAVPWLGARPVVYSRRQMTFSFGVELAGSGTAGTAPAWGKFLQACGFSQTIVSSTVVYSPISSGFPSLTMKGNQDGVQYVGLGCRGSFEISCEVGEIPRIDFEFMGAYVSPADVALATPTYTNQAVPITFASGNTVDATLDGYAFCISEFSADLSNEMAYRELVGCTKSNKIKDRAVEGEITVERPDTLALKNLYPKIEAHTNVALAFTHGTVAGNKVKIEMPTLQLNFPEADDDDGILMHNYEFKAIPVSPGNNELKITVF
jgi:hypothetical protein